MTVPYKPARRVVVNTGAVSTIFVDFPVEKASDVTVYVGVPGVQQLSLGSDYTVDGVGGTSAAVNINNPGAWGAYEAFAVYVEYVVDQSSDVDSGGTLGKRFEDALDRQTRVLQSFSDKVNRAVKLPVTTAVGQDATLDPAPYELIGWNAEGTALVTYPSVSVSTQEALEAAITAVEAAAAAVAAANSQFSFNTMADFIASMPPTVSKAVTVRGYYAAGDCPTFELVRLTSAPTVVMPWHLLTAGGSWWTYAPGGRAHVGMFGAKPSGLPVDAVSNAKAVQDAINFKYMVCGGGVVYCASGVYFFASTIYLPTATILAADTRHPVLREYGDTTGGVDHPVKGTTFVTSGPGAARRITDELQIVGVGGDAAYRTGFALMGEGAGLHDITGQTLDDASAWDIGLIICGVSRVSIKGVDIRGPWLKTAHRWDATWGRTNPRIMSRSNDWAYLADLPWFTADYAAIYDFGLTNNIVESSRFEGASAIEIESGANVAYAVNGLSDGKFIDCEFYNDPSARTQATRNGLDGRLIRLNYRLGGSLGGAQGLSMESCRFDGGSRWTFDIDFFSNLDVNVGREFSETSEAYQALHRPFIDGVQSGAPLWLTATAYTVGKTVTQGASAYRCLVDHTSGVFATDLAANRWSLISAAEQRGRLRTTTNTTTNANDLLRFDGEWFMNISARNAPGADNGENIGPAAWVPRAAGGRRIEIKHGQSRREFNVFAGGEAGGVQLRTGDGNVSLVDIAGDVITTWAVFTKNDSNFGSAADNKWSAVTVTFQRASVPFLSYDGLNLKSLPVYADTTANSPNVIVETDGRLRRATSAFKYKKDVRDIPEDMVSAMLKLRGVLYTDANPDNDQTVVHVGSIADEAAACGLGALVVYGDDGDIENFRYDRAFSVLLELVKRQDARIAELEKPKDAPKRQR